VQQLRHFGTAVSLVVVVKKNRNLLLHLTFTLFLRTLSARTPRVKTAPSDLEDLTHLLDSKLGAMSFDERKSQFFSLLKM